MANLLTLIRIPLAALLWLRPHDPTWLITIIAIAGASDAIDGRFARAVRRRSTAPDLAERAAVGAWLDPVCDKLFAASMLAALWYGADAPLAAVVLALTRELLLAPLVALYHLLPEVRGTLQSDFRADWLGKLTTTIQFAVAAALLVAPPAALPLAIAAAVTGAWTAAHYVYRSVIAARRAAR